MCSENSVFAVGLHRTSILSDNEVWLCCYYLCYITYIKIFWYNFLFVLVSLWCHVNTVVLIS